MTQLLFKENGLPEPVNRFLSILNAVMGRGQSDVLIVWQKKLFCQFIYFIAWKRRRAENYESAHLKNTKKIFCSFHKCS